jgi:micrococcal nuclease
MDGNLPRLRPVPLRRCQVVRRPIITLILVLLALVGGQRVLDAHARHADGRVLRVVDGDTLHVSVHGRDETVRVIGIDTPELHRPATPVECGARLAARAMRRLAAGRRVTLVADPTQDRRDRYGRLLAYVDARGGGDLGAAMVRRGWAMVYVYENHPFQRVARYRAAAAHARHSRLGVDGRCGGDFHSAS